MPNPNIKKVDTIKANPSQSRTHKPSLSKTTSNKLALDSLSQNICSVLNTGVSLQNLSLITSEISEFAKSQKPNWAYEIMSRCDMTLSKKAELIALTCGDCLNEDGVNHVSRALDMPDEDQKSLFSEWLKPESSLLHKGLALYFCPLDLWYIKGMDIFWEKLQDQLKNSKLPKHLYPAIKIKSLFVENKLSDAIQLLKDSKKMIRHLHLAHRFNHSDSYPKDWYRHKFGYENELHPKHEYLRPYQNVLSKQRMLAAERYSPCWEVDFSGIDFTDANFTKAIFYAAKLVKTNFTHAELTAAQFMVEIDATEAIFCHANLESSSLHGCFLRADFTYANVANVLLQTNGVRFFEVVALDFTDANFHGVDFSTIRVHSSLSQYSSFMALTESSFVNSNLIGAPFMFLQCLPDYIVREVFDKACKDDARLKPFIDYFARWKPLNFLSYFLFEYVKTPALHEEYCAVLGLLHHSKESNDSLNQFLMKLSGESRRFKIALDEFNRLNKLDSCVSVRVSKPQAAH